MNTVIKGFRFPYSEEMRRQYANSLECAKNMPASTVQEINARDSVTHNYTEAIWLLDLFDAINDILEASDVFVFEGQDGRFGFFYPEDHELFVCAPEVFIAEYLDHKELAEAIHECFFPAPDYEPNEY